MSNRNDLNLSLASSTFALLKSQFDGVLERTIENMQTKGADEATINIKLRVELDKGVRSTPDGYVDVTIPTFTHEINSVMQVRDRACGKFIGDYQLVFDEEESKYVIREIDDGQMKMFDAPQDDDTEEDDMESEESDYEYDSPEQEG